MFWLCRVALIRRIVEGSGGPDPFVLTWMSYPARFLILVHSENLVYLTLSVLLLHAP